MLWGDPAGMVELMQVQVSDLVGYHVALKKELILIAGRHKLLYQSLKAKHCTHSRRSGDVVQRSAMHTALANLRTQRAVFDYA